MDEKMVAILADLGIGILWMAFAMPLIQGRVKRNPWYGFRTPKTLGSDEVWYPANAHAGRGMFHCGRLLVAGGLLLWVFQSHLTIGQVNGISLVLLVVPIAVWLVSSFRFLSRL